jgi:hypothetical protein
MNGRRCVTLFTMYASAVCLLFGYASYRGAGSLLEVLPLGRTRSGGVSHGGGVYHK